MASDGDQRALLMILLAASERTLEEFQRAGRAADADFAANLEQFIARVSDELARFVRPS